MKLKKPQVDYLKLRPNNILSPEYKHVLYLLYWPVYGLMFMFLERFYKVDSYFPMHCALDDKIPFCEAFLIPYLFWFVYLIGMIAYTFFYDVDTFKRMMRYIIITYSVTVLVYFLFPTCQNLRPESFERDNMLTRFIAGFYAFDTNTNVCPSIHVIGSLAVVSAGLFTKNFKSKAFKIVIFVTGVLICISTVFMKQHSVLDILAALPICIVAHFICFRRNKTVKYKFSFEEERAL